MYSSPLRVCTIAGTLPQKYVVPENIKDIVDSDQARRKKDSSILYSNTNVAKPSPQETFTHCDRCSV